MLACLPLWLLASRAVAFGPPPPVVLFVDPDSPAPAGGLTWETAYHRLELAIAAAVLAGTEIRVAQGTYRPDGGLGDRNPAFELKPGIAIRGGYAGFGAGDPNLRNISLFQTILSGDIGVIDDASDNSYHVLRVIGTGDGAVLDGFTVTGGNANGTSPNDRGGGILLGTSGLQIVNCVFSFNQATTGGAVDMSSSASPQFENSSFIANSATGNGGAVSCVGANPTFLGCTFVDNNSDVSGGAVFMIGGSPSVIACAFIQNSALVFGGAVYSNTSLPEFLSCTFSGNFLLNSLNVVFDGGGALHNDGGTVLLTGCLLNDNVTSDDGGAVLNLNGTAVFERCTLRKNWSADRGGGIYSYNATTQLRSCILLANAATNAGGGLVNVNGNPTILRSTLVNNRSTSIGGGIHTSGAALTLNSTILWGNFDSGGMSEIAQVKLISGSVQIDYCAMMGWTGAWGGVGNFAGPVDLVDADGPDNIPGTSDDDVRLLPTSPCINAGSLILIPPVESMDIEGHPRNMGCRLDIGAHEFYVGPAHSGDMDGNGIIDANDLRLFIPPVLGTGPLAYWCVADMNADSAVDLQDVPLFVALILGM